MNKEELLKEISKTEEHLASMKKMLRECEYERWKPKNGKIFYFVDSDGDVVDAYFDGSSDYDVSQYNARNCFQTEQEAEQEAEKILIRRQLEDIARRLNKGEKIDWSNENQYKWYIIYNTFFGFETYSVSENTTQGTVYCLDKNFLNTAIKEIGEGRLLTYLRGE